MVSNTFIKLKNIPTELHTMAHIGIKCAAITLIVTEKMACFFSFCYWFFGIGKMSFHHQTGLPQSSLTLLWGFLGNDDIQRATCHFIPLKLQE